MLKLNANIVMIINLFSRKEKRFKKKTTAEKKT